jgi:hypothetical protein
MHARATPELGGDAPRAALQQDAGPSAPARFRTAPAMILLLGDTHDPVCNTVQEALRARGARMHRSALLFGSPARFRWWIEAGGTRSEVELPGGDVLSEREIVGVLARRTPCIASDGWSPRDLSYVHAEASAAALGWLWSLRCPVVGRMPSALWYRSEASLLGWGRALDRAGLKIQESVATNDLEEAWAFCGDVAVLHLLGPDAAYLVRTEEEWESVEALMERGPVCLTRPHGAVDVACVVGDEVVWGDGARPWLESRMLAFSRQVGLSLAELAVSGPEGGEEVVSVDAHPRLTRFAPAQLERIADHICVMLGAREGLRAEVRS